MLPISPQQPPTTKHQSFILWFDQVGIADIPLVGGKNASLGEMIQQLGAQGVQVPTGFATTAHAYRTFLQQSQLEAPLRQLLQGLDVEDIPQLRARAQQARELILTTPFSPGLELAISEAYSRLCQHCGEQSSLSVAVRSSATAEDLPDASFAGQQETYLNVQGLRGVLEACHKCFASLFTDRAISYRTLKGFDHFTVALAVGVQQMVRSGTAGVMFSIDTETGFDQAVLITAAYGLGETVVQGAVNPDEYLVFKPTLQQGYQPILSKRLGSKEIKMVYDQEGSKLTKNVPVSAGDRQKFTLTNPEILTLAQWACKIEDHYSAVRGTYTPMDIEWAQDEFTGELYIVQARPETVQSQKSDTLLRTYQLDTTGSVLSTGRAVGELIGQGRGQIIQHVSQISAFQPGDVLITHKTDPDWEPIMKQAAAIVTNQGGRTCHAAIIARELGIPAIVGCGNATHQIPNGRLVTVACCEGEVGHVYDGLLSFTVQETQLEQLPTTQTKILLNVGNPDQAFRLAALPCDGVGIARLEFIIANHIKAHPLALIHFDQLDDPLAQQEITHLTRHYPYKPDFFVDQLTHGVGIIAAAFYPKPVIVRLSDFKSNEYANLLGGQQFEPQEENPMLGWRGASRYYDDKFREAFGLECKALKIVRDEMGLTNVIPMVPFCRTPEEGRKVIAEMENAGLVQGENGLQVYVMCEVPSNVILADQFSQIFDGFSIGSNDLTQLALGIDRDSALVAHLFDERHEGVQSLIRQVIDQAKRHHCKVGICGQAPSDYPEFAQFLVEQGIDSISLNPDSVLKTRFTIAQAETHLSSSQPS
ncbi:phosphoenolpyruvate synthase [Acaryochloris marina]|uniref:phosphoenolpyruvate synthase n=1 Tax=Acaryochloris marina TaxID=155978 RepID=UPI0021C374D5|nr:phosphoenolpyruvate synthase [Acaryochloris marina]BDM81454.1 phosphoenolpyruvate synthase [Acaryochloris marina MBIC10699]